MSVEIAPVTPQSPVLANWNPCLEPTVDRRRIKRRPTYICGNVAITKRSSLPGSFTTLDSLLKIMVARVLAS